MRAGKYGARSSASRERGLPESELRRSAASGSARPSRRVTSMLSDVSSLLISTAATSEACAMTPVVNSAP